MIRIVARNAPILFLWIPLLFVIGCATSRPLPKIIYPKAVYPMDHYLMSVESGGLKVAAVPFAPGRDVYTDPAKAAGEPTQGSLNVLEAGVLPIRLIIINETDDEIAFDPDQIVGVSDSVLYRIYSPQEAVDLVIESHAFKEAIKGSRVGPVVKSVLGGEILVEAVKGGVGGVASGGITGGASGVAKGATGTGMERAEGYEKALIRLITTEYTEQAIGRQTLYPGYIAEGLVFLPGRAGITELRVQAYDLNTKKGIPLRMALP